MLWWDCQVVAHLCDWHLTDMCPLNVQIAEFHSCADFWDEIPPYCHVYEVFCLKHTTTIFVQCNVGKMMYNIARYKWQNDNILTNIKQYDKE